MHVYFAAQSKDFKLLTSENVNNILTSFAFCKSPQKILESFNGVFPERLIIDSGAFSVWTKGEVIDIDKYANFCQELKKILPKEIDLNIVNLDVLPGRFGQRPTTEQRELSAEAGWANMLYLEGKGLKVIHVFHQHEDFKWLDKLREHSDYIGISPANDVSMKEKMNWLNKVFGVLRDTKKAHGFAVTSDVQLTKYPFYSVDSSSWSAASRYGRVATFGDKKLRTFSYKKRNEIINNWETIKDKSQALLHGSDEDRLRQGIRSYLQLQKDITNLWTKRGIIWQD